MRGGCVERGRSRRPRRRTPCPLCVFERVCWSQRDSAGWRLRPTCDVASWAGRCGRAGRTAACATHRCGPGQEGDDLGKVVLVLKSEWVRAQETHRVGDVTRPKRFAICTSRVGTASCDRYRLRCFRMSERLAPGPIRGCFCETRNAANTWMASLSARTPCSSMILHDP